MLYIFLDSHHDGLILAQRTLNFQNCIITESTGAGKTWLDSALANAACRADLLELIEDRCGVGSTLITSVLPVKEWSKYINDPSYADSILDRNVLNSHRIEINSAQSMRSNTAYGAVKP